MSPRLVFTLGLSGLAVPVALFVARGFVGFQADALSDMLKIALLIGAGAAVIAFTFWTVLHLTGRSLWRSLLAGGLSSALVLMIPFSAYAFKSAFAAQYALQPALVAALSDAVPAAVAAGLSTFVVLTKVSLGAVMAGAIFGWIVGRYVPVTRA